MEKRTDLAQLFCMIGRHAPAVAVAVIAMVSVVAGFFIYRTVAGKRRKAAAGAAAGDGAAGSRGAPEAEETRSCVESTDLGEDDLLDMKVTNVTRSPYNLRKRRDEKNAKSTSPKKELQPENGLGSSHVLDSSIVAEKCAKAAWTVEDVCNLTLPDDEPLKDAEEVHSSCLTPEETSAGHENEEVPKAQEVEVTVNNVLDEKPTEMEDKLASNSPTCPENTPAIQNHDDAQKENRTTPETINMDSCLEEPVICMTGVILSSKEIPHPDHIKFSDGNNCISSGNVESVPQIKRAHDQPMTLDHVTGYSTEQTKVPSSQQGQYEISGMMLGNHDGVSDADSSPFSEVLEKSIDEDHLKHLAKVDAVTLEHIGQELKSEHTHDSPCNQEDCSKGVTSSFEECNGSNVISIALPCLNQVAELETMQDQDLCATKADFCGFAPVGLQQVKEGKYAVFPKLPEDAGLDGLTFEPGSLKTTKNETVKDVVIPEPSLDNLLSSFRDADAAVCKKPAEIVCSDMPSFQNQEREQVQLDFSEVATVPVPDMAESTTMCQGQLLSFDHGELMWSSSGVGEESGISSMTVSPDLPDMECDITPDSVVRSVTCQYPESEGHVEDQWNFVAEKVKFVSKDIPADLPFELCPHELAHSEHTKASALPPTNKDTSGQETENGKQRKDHLMAQVVASEVCLMNEMDIKADVESEQKEMAEKDKMTEINIMEATMDTNEWITDGNHEVLPWINLSVSSLPHNTQTASVSSEHHLNSVPVDSSCKNADPLFTEVKQSGITNESKGSDKKVVAVQPMPQNVKVTFRIHYLTSPYQKVAVTGNKQELGNWKGFIPLEKAKDGHWSIVVNLPAESHVEWKFVVVNQDVVCRWEECGNRLLDTGSAEDLLVHKWWGFL